MSISVTPNSVVQLLCEFTSTPEGQPDPAVDWDVTGATDNRTSISNEGVLKVGPGEAGPLTVVAGWVNDDWTVGTQTVAIEVDPAGAPYWPQEPGTGPTPSPATVEFTVKSDGDTDAVSPLAKASRWTVLLESDQALPADAQVALTTSNPAGVQMTRVAHSTNFVAYMLSIAPTAEDAATVSLTASGTGITSQTKEYTVATAA